MFIQWIRKQKGTSVWQHYILPILAICGSVFMVIACLVSHGMGCFWYLIVFAFVMVLGGAQPQNAAHRAGRWRLSRFALMRNRVPSASERCGGDSAYMNE